MRKAEALSLLTFQSQQTKFHGFAAGDLSGSKLQSAGAFLQFDGADGESLEVLHEGLRPWAVVVFGPLFRDIVGFRDGEIEGGTLEAEFTLRASLLGGVVEDHLVVSVGRDLCREGDRVPGRRPVGEIRAVRMPARPFDGAMRLSIPRG